MNRLTLDVKIRIVRLYSKSDENASEVRRKLYQLGIDEGRWGKVGLEKADIPSINTIKSINEHFNKTGRVDQVLSQGGNQKRKKRVVTPENIERVEDELFRSPETPKSHRRISYTLGISPSSIYNILKELKMKPYIPRLHHGLNFAKFGMNRPKLTHILQNVFCGPTKQNSIQMEP